jgi:hypothetical protein
VKKEREGKREEERGRMPPKKEKKDERAPAVEEPEVEDGAREVQERELVISHLKTTLGAFQDRGASLAVENDALEEAVAMEVGGLALYPVPAPVPVPVPPSPSPSPSPSPRPRLRSRGGGGGGGHFSPRFLQSKHQYVHVTNLTQPGGVSANPTLRA